MSSREQDNRTAAAFVVLIVAISAVCLLSLFVGKESREEECKRIHKVYSCPMKPDHSAFDKRPTQL